MPSLEPALTVLCAPALSLLLFALCWAARPGLLGGFFANLTILLGGAAFAWFALSSHNVAAQALLALLGILVVLTALFGLYLLIVLLLLNSRVMLQRERPRLANMLTLLLALGLIALVALAAFDPLRWLPRPLRSFLGGCSLILPYLLFDAMNFLTAAGLCALHRPLGRLDYILVLGSGLIDGEDVYKRQHLSIGKFPQWDNDANYKLQNYDVVEQIELPDDRFYRIDTYNCYDNLGLFLDRPCIRCFNSTVTPSILQFYPGVGVKRDVSSKPELELYALRGLLSVEYLLMPAGSQADFLAEDAQTGFVFDGLTGDGVYARYRNENAVPMGFTYDYYVLPETVETVSKEKRGNLYLRAIGLSEEQAAQYGQNMEPLPEALAGGFSYESYVQDCADRRARACSSFAATRDGFTAAITLEKDNLVFFSVPYDEGFAATVNGEAAEVLNVDGGLIAIPAKAGENEITLTLTPKWLPLSCGLTAAGALLYAGYLALTLLRRHRQGPLPGRFVPLEVAAGYPSALWDGAEESVYKYGWILSQCTAYA